MGSSIEIDGRDGKFAAYVAKPATLPAPAVVVLHEVFGVNDDIRGHCDALAADGFLAVAPDLFWRLEPGVDLGITSEEDWQHGLRLYMAYDRDAGVGDVADTIAAVAAMPESSGKVGILGYCLGGLMVWLTAVRSGADAAVAFHGGETDKYLGEADGLKAPLLMHLADEDEYIPKDAEAAIIAALADRPGVEIHTYAGQAHAFSRLGGAHYDAASADLANRRTSDFLHANLDG